MEHCLIWIDAAEFSKYGGWKLDTQFIRESGIAYLIADGAGTPVSDAETFIDIPAEWTYRIWARTRNWIKDYTPGTFTLSLGSKTNAAKCGAQPSDLWKWEIAGDFRVKKGIQKLTLHDLSGFYGRCSAVIISNDFDFTPDQDNATFFRTRTILKKESGIIGTARFFDVVVAGGGPAGISDALASARMGKETALIQNRAVLGGNLSVEAGIRFSGAARSHLGCRETGIAEEILRTRDHFDISWSDACALLVRHQENLSVFMEEEIINVELGESFNIASFITQNVKTNTRQEYIGNIFIDCTGDGWPGYYSGAKYRYGRETSFEYGEEDAPACGDTITMSGSLIENGTLSFFLEMQEDKNFFDLPEWVEKLPQEKKLGRTAESRQDNITDARDAIIDGIQGYWWVELPGTYDELWEGEIARYQMIKMSFSIFDFFKNSWSQKAESLCYTLKRIPLFLAKRESRRFIGDYVLTENDCKEGKVFADAISYGGFPIDIHHPEGIFSGEEGPHQCFLHVPIYTIPYRCLYSKNIPNLFFAGRNISATHCAMGSVRVQATTSTLGQAAGTAAALCCDYEISPKELGTHYISNVQQILVKNDQYIPGVENKYKKDIAQKARVNASSVSSCECFSKKPVQCGPENIINGFTRIIDQDHYQWVSDPDSKMPQWIELTFAQPVLCSSIHITFETDLSNLAQIQSGPIVPSPCVISYGTFFYHNEDCLYKCINDNNYLRKKIYSFLRIRIDRIRLTVYETGGNPSARINEIRLY
jgi:hypothetical protein